MAPEATEGSDASGDASGGWFGRAVDGPHHQELRECRCPASKGGCCGGHGVGAVGVYPYSGLCTYFVPSNPLVTSEHP